MLLLCCFVIADMHVIHQSGSKKESTLMIPQKQINTDKSEAIIKGDQQSNDPNIFFLHVDYVFKL